jgi:hypothetical protein
LEPLTLEDGCLVLAADPSLRDLDDDFDMVAAPARRDEDWTTTGLLAPSELVR